MPTPMMTGGNYALRAPRFGSSPGMIGPPTISGFVPPPSMGAMPHPSGTNMSPYFAQETPDAMTGSGIGGQPFNMQNTAPPFDFAGSWWNFLRS